MSFLRVAFTLTCVSAALSGQFNPIVSGFVHDAEQHALRPIVGIPGSAYIGRAIGPEMEAAWLAPNSKWAIGIQNGATVVLRGLDELKVSVEADSTLLTGTTEVAWNAEGTIAALYSARTRQLQRVRVSDGGLLTNPAQEIGYLDSGFRAFVVSGLGQIAIVGSETIYIVDEGNAPRRLGAALGAASITSFSEEVLYSAGPAGLLEYSTRTPESEPQWKGPAPNAVMGLSAARKLGKITIASGSEAKLYIYDRREKTFSEVALDRPPSYLVALQADSMFLLNGPESGQPAIVFDLKRGAQTFFVPGLGEGAL